MPRRNASNRKTLKLWALWVPLVLASISQSACHGGSTTTSKAAHSVELSWAASSSPGVEIYRVYRASQSGGPYIIIGSTSRENRSFTDGNVQSGSTYFYVVTALDHESHESTNSNEVKTDIPRP